MGEVKSPERKEPEGKPIPCFGGPYDGKFHVGSTPPIGYRKFPIRERSIYLWKSFRPEYLDFLTVYRASQKTPEEISYKDEDIFDSSQDVGL